MPRPITFLAKGLAAEMTLERLDFEMDAYVLLHVVDSVSRQLATDLAVKSVVKAFSDWVYHFNSPVVLAIH